MGTRLSKAPVCFTLGQMRFNPVLSIDLQLPQLQEAFRGLGFPDYAPARITTVEISSVGDGMKLDETTIQRFVFRNRAETAALILDPGALSYELTDYPDFDEFKRIFVEALDIVHQHRPIEYCDRLGLRMLDAVQPAEGHTLTQYLVPQALGFADFIGADITHQQTLTESLFERDSRTLLVRTVRVPNGIATPPDISPLRLKLRERFLAYRGETVMLDCDSANTKRSDYSPDAALAELADLKAFLSRSFKALVTPFALESWA